MKVESVKKFNKGGIVRIRLFKKPVTKGYLPNWSKEIYTTQKVQSKVLVICTINDETGNIIEGGFYNAELRKQHSVMCI